MRNTFIIVKALKDILRYLRDTQFQYVLFLKYTLCNEKKNKNSQNKFGVKSQVQDK